MATVSENTNKTFYTWEQFNNDCYKLVNTITNSGWTPDVIVGIKRGGLVPAIKLSHLFSKPLVLVSCQTRDGEDAKVDLLEASSLSPDKNILIVDDICDSGFTFEKITNEFILNGLDKVKCCSLYYNRSQPFLIDYSVTTIDRLSNSKWIVFPWEV